MGNCSSSESNDESGDIRRENILKKITELEREITLYEKRGFAALPLGNAPLSSRTQRAYAKHAKLRIEQCWAEIRRLRAELDYLENPKKINGLGHEIDAARVHINEFNRDLCSSGARIANSKAHPLVSNSKARAAKSYELPKLLAVGKWENTLAHAELEKEEASPVSARKIQELEKELLMAREAITDLEKKSHELEDEIQIPTARSKSLGACLATVKWQHVVHHIENEKQQASLQKKLRQTEEASIHAVTVVQPLQQCIENGDVLGLRCIVDDLKPNMSSETRQREAYGAFANVVVPFYEAADSKLRIWHHTLNTIKSTIESINFQGSDVSRSQARRLFCALREASLSGMNLQKTDPEISSQIAKLLMAYFVQDGCIGNSLQKKLIERIVSCKGFLEFDFADMSDCLTLANKSESEANDFFMSRARDLVVSHEVHEFKDLLTRLDTVIFYLCLLDKEDIALTYEQYRKLPSNAWASELLRVAESQFCQGQALVDFAGCDLFRQEDLQRLLSQLQKSSAAGGSRIIDNLKPIIYWWAKTMMEKFNLLVLPHHTQVVCLLMCLEFIKEQEDAQTDGVFAPTYGQMNSQRLPGALIAEVGTGEGKSAVIGMLALYCVAVLKKQVHVVIDDENLLERDFQQMRDLFAHFQGNLGVQVVAKLCVDTSRRETYFKNDCSVVDHIEENADLVYCEAKHIQSFYTRLAKRGGTNFDNVYKNRVLILDEVDALVIDESPNVPFVYENETASTFATKIADALKLGVPSDKVREMAATAAEEKIARSMEHAARTIDNWIFHHDYAFEEEANQYFLVQKNRVNHSAWSLALEYKNFLDGFSDHITYNERLFVMSRPRTFRKYQHVIGLSGSVGSPAERVFLQTMYNAKFFQVPKFLETCLNSVCHEPVPLGVQIQEDARHQQLSICETALQIREQAPVLIIAENREKAVTFVEKLQAMANARGLRGNDVVRLVSHSLYESNRDLFKENLFQFTQPMSKGGNKSFRIGITGPRGGRGMDYRVTDADANAAGGLALIVQYIPKSSRDWIQYLGRTARQGCQGQWTAILNKQDYADEIKSTGRELVPETAAQTILDWGNAEVEGKLREFQDLYHRGLRMSELSEAIAERWLLKTQQNHAIMVGLCNSYTSMSISQIDEAAGKIEGLCVNRIPTSAIEVGADAKVVHTMRGADAPRSIIVLLDRSASMSSTDAGRRSRFDVCRSCITQIVEKNVADEDFVGLYTFESNILESFPLTQKGPNRRHLAALIRDLPKPDGLTRFYDGVSKCLDLLRESSTQSKFLIALTDGDDNMSASQPNGELVSEMLRNGIPGLNLIMITCGMSIKDKSLSLMQQWTCAARSSGNIGMYIPADRPKELVNVFAKVADIISMDGDGECES